MATPNGTTHTLHCGSYAATILGVGATIQSLTYAGDDLVLPFDGSQIPPAFSGKTLAPWPNRVARGTYSFQGQTHQLPINEHSTGSALHGLALWEQWLCVESGDSYVCLQHRINGLPGYPFQLDLTAEFRLSAEAGLSVTIAATNFGAGPAPYGVSLHPFLTCGSSADTWHLHFAATHVLDVDENLIPTRLRPVAGTTFDFSNPRTLGNQVVDHAFTGFPAGIWEASVSDPNSGRATVLSARAAEAGANWLQIYSGELRGRRGIAMEPMTCAPDAFNSGEGLIILEPEATHTFSFSIGARDTR